jgi:predicted nucleic acid-binding protein
LTSYVVDASVVVKWYFPEIHEAAALRLRSEANILIAPGLLLAEFGNVALKFHRRGEISLPNIQLALAAIHQRVTLAQLETLAPSAAAIAVTYQRSLYDALYVTLAIEEECPLVTADRKLYDAIAPSLPGAMLWIEDVA